jgi:hypothetical protein
MPIDRGLCHPSGGSGMVRVHCASAGRERRRRVLGRMDAAEKNMGREAVLGGRFHSKISPACYRRSASPTNEPAAATTSFFIQRRCGRPASSRAAAGPRPTKSHSSWRWRLGSTWLRPKTCRFPRQVAQNEHGLPVLGGSCPYLTAERLDLAHARHRANAASGKQQSATRLGNRAAQLSCGFNPFGHDNF